MVEELYEYKNLGVPKNCAGSFSSNAEKNFTYKTRKSLVGIFFPCWLSDS